MISIITSCVKRELYLKRLLDSINALGGWKDIEFEHLIVFQGAPPSQKMRDYLEGLPFYRNIKVGQTNKIEPIGAILNSSIKKAKYPIVFKIDDDNALMSPDFLPRALELCMKMPRGVIYPMIVEGELISDGGREEKWQTVYLEKSNVYISLGEAVSVSGKYLLPLDLAQKIQFVGQNDAPDVVVHTLQNHLPIFQVFNGLVIENQDGFSGQYHRAKNPSGQLW